MVLLNRRVVIGICWIFELCNATDRSFLTLWRHIDPASDKIKSVVIGLLKIWAPSRKNHAETRSRPVEVMQMVKLVKYIKFRDVLIDDDDEIANFSVR